MVRTVAVLALVVWCSADCLIAEDVAKGTLLIGEKNYKLNQAVAYETRSDDERFLVVLLSDRKIATATIKEELRENEGSDEGLFLTQPHVRLVFKPSGGIYTCSVFADNNSFSGEGEGLKGEMQADGGRVAGKAKLHYVSRFDTVTSFDVEFNIPVGLDVQPRTVAPGTPAKVSITGTFLGNDKPAKLAFVTARRDEPFNDKPSILLVFTEKDHSRDPKPDFKAGFGEYGSALILRAHEDGSVFGCEVAHAAHEMSGFSAIGRLRAAAFDVGADRIEGHFTTEGKVTSFNQTWSVDVKFTVPFKNDTAQPSATEPAPKEPQPKPDPKPANKPAKEKPDAKPAGNALNVYQLPFPQGSKIEYKQLVQQMVVTSDASVQQLAAQLTKAFGEQGWNSKGADLITAASAILNLERGEATLTLMVKPDGKGSRITVFSSGLDWKKP